MAVVAFTAQGLTAGMALVALANLFSLAQSACSMAFKDVRETPSPKTGAACS
jgi:hypothetical protein